VPQTLSYLSNSFKKIDKPLIFGVGMFDVWGSVCYAQGFFQGCEDSRNNVASSFKRAKEIGSQLMLVTDFSVLQKDLSIKRPSSFSGAHEINQSELSKIVDQAKNNQQKTMLITNLYDGENGARNNINYQTASDSQIEKLFSGWKKIIVGNALKAKNAGVDYFVVNPRDIQLDSFENKKSLVNKGYADIISDVKKQYNGKICFWGNIWTLTDANFTFMKDVDCVIEDWGINNIMKNAQDNVGSIENAWATHLGRGEFGKLVGKEVFIMILMPSYKGAMQKGWIEPVIGYPVGTYVRDWEEQALVYEGLFRAIYNGQAEHVDGIISYGYWWTDTLHPDSKMANGLGQSIRDKDAEQVFYNWTKIFNNP
jgi:hypothetical protein